MRAGNLKHKIDIQTFTKSKNDFGEVIKRYVSFKTVYAEIKPLSAKEFYLSGTKAEATHKIIMRFVDGINYDMRIVYNSRIFEIESILNIREENKVLHLICTEKL